MVKYYCDRCEKEIKEEQFKANPTISIYKETIPQFGAIRFTKEESPYTLCVECMRKYIKFLKECD